MPPASLSGYYGPDTTTAPILMISLRFPKKACVLQMTVAAKRSAMTEVWTQWEGQVVNGIYPLRRFLNASEHSSVFLTESTTEGFLNAAIKLIPADPALTKLQLWHWKTAATFSHPHLIRLLDSGQCEIAGHPLLFVVMEYAEETLSQILPIRALEPGEVRELLVPTLDALAFLHRENWVQGQLKPSNFLVVNDQLKLASDTFRPAGAPTELGARLSLYDPPEIERGEVSAATDVWALGVTLVEALTQSAPTWPNGRSEPPALPANLPATFVDTVQRCLSLNPADRPTIADLQAQTKPTPSAAPAPASQPPPPRPEPVAPAPRPESVMRAAPHSFSLEPEPPKRGLTPASIAAVAVVLVGAVIAWRMFHVHSNGPQPAEVVSQTSSQPGGESAVTSEDQPPAASAASGGSPASVPPGASAPSGASAPPAAATSAAPASRSHTPASAPGRSASHTAVPQHATPGPAEQRPQQSANTSLVLHEEIPKVPQSARATIRGRVKVAVRVTVDRSGNVVRDTFENAGPSKYFNRLASQAARKWKFASVDNESAREWLLHFEFGRDGTTVHATPRSRS
jgi:eukaryotic-like serine/threonine-protein kinase